MNADADALVIGAGPAGAASAIHLAQAGWQVLLVEQSSFPRQKVCGECLSAAALAQLDELGVGPAVNRLAGPDLRQVSFSHGASSVTAKMPPCDDGPHRFGRALGRDHLDQLLAERAAAVGVTLMQPARVRAVRGVPGDYICHIEAVGDTPRLRRVPVVIDAHGSWEAGPWERGVRDARRTRRGSDLFGFKASFHDARLAPGVLPVLAFPGGYGGMVVADGGRLTLAGCIRRDTLGLWRARLPETPAGLAFEHYLRQHNRELADVLAGAHRVGSWLSVGPLRPGIHGEDLSGPFRVGNAAVETHPLIGEGINTALQSARFLAHHLVRESPQALAEAATRRIQRETLRTWRKAFAARLHLAALYAGIAMHPALTVPFSALLRGHPPLLTRAARFAGKSRRPIERSPPVEVPHEHA